MVWDNHCLDAGEDDPEERDGYHYEVIQERCTKVFPYMGNAKQWARMNGGGDIWLVMGNGDRAKIA